MRRTLKLCSITLLILGLLLVAAFATRDYLIIHLVALTLESGLKPAVDEGKNARWFDDYYTIHAIDNDTYAIGETRYWQNNFNYLIVGDERAILFDAGAGIRDIRPLVESLVDVPVLFIPSHLHYDHLGNEVKFEQTGLIDLPHLRAAAIGSQLVPESLQHAGWAEDIAAPILNVSQWLAPGSSLQLGGRLIEVVYTPGHTADSVSLVDAEAGYAFTGDFLVPGVLSEVTYGGAMGDYLQGVEALLKAAPAEGRMFGAHRPLLPTNEEPPLGLPEMDMQVARDLRDALVAIRDGRMKGSGLYPKIYMINPTLELWANPPWMQEWEPGYPQFSPR